MKRALLSLLSLLSLVLAFAAVGAAHRGLSSARHEIPTRLESAEGTVGNLLANRDDPRLRAAIRRQLREGEAGTYIGEILKQRDSALARWPDRSNRPLRVWIQPSSRVADWTDDFVSEVRSAFLDWDALELPVRFVFSSDSAGSDVHVTWIDRFEQPISGRTKWARDDNWWITDADIVLAVHHHQGELLDADAMRAMALHEIGHLLGLDHTHDSANIMAPRVRVRELSPADVATARLLYTLPPGAVR